MKPFDFSLRQLQYAVAVADSLSFRKAAQRCRVSQPALSAQLAQLERALGANLFERDRRRVLVTPGGHAIVERARVVLREAEDLAEIARSTGDPLAGTLRIGILPTISPYLLPRIAPALRADFPRLTVKWAEDKTAALVRELAAGSLEAAVLALEAELGEVDHAVIARDPFVLAAPASHPLGRARGRAKPADLRDESVLLLDDEHCFGKQALALCARARARELEFRGTSLATIAQMVAGGAGVTLLPALAAPVEAEQAKLRVRRFTEPEPARTIALVWRRRSPLAESLRKVAGAMARAYPK